MKIVLICSIEKDIFFLSHSHVKTTLTQIAKESFVRSVLNMKKKHIILVLAFLVVAHGFGTYAALDRYLSSNAEVEIVMEMPNASVNADGTDSAAKPAGKTFSTNEPNGKWNVDLMNMAVMSGEGVVDMASLDSGNTSEMAM